MRFAAPEFTSLCPITGQPDFAHLVIDYVPDARIVESKSLKLFLGSYRNHGAFHEGCTVEIANRLVDAMAPKWLRIGGYWYRAAAFRSTFSTRPVRRLGTSGFRSRAFRPIGAVDDVLIVGAGPAGLACAACLARAGVGYRVVERAGSVGSSWRRHYDRLHLHTDRGHSGLPYYSMPRSFPRYPTAGGNSTVGANGAVTPAETKPPR